MCIRKASIKETGEELSQEEWARFDKAIATVQAERARGESEAAVPLKPVPETLPERR